MGKLIFFDIFKWRVFLIVIGGMIESVGKNVVSILMSLLIESIYEKNIKWAYIYGTIISVVNMICLVDRHYS